MWDRKDFLDIDSLSLKDIELILKCSEILEDYSGRGNKLNMCRGEILVTAFFEPSTRTEKSFEAAMYVLGGDVLRHHEAGSSREKGESKIDTLHVLEQYSDIIAIRDPEVGMMRSYADALKIPVINAGDGFNQHPTQTILDLYTIKKEVGKLTGLTVVFFGDLKYGRTVHSLIKALRLFGNNKFYGVSPKGLELTDVYTGKDYKEIEMDQVVNIKPDVIYSTRIQKERMHPEETDNYSYEINKKFMEKLPPKTKIMHPLPRIDEIHPEIDDDPRFIPFKQVRNGLHTRMALLALMLDHEKEILDLSKKR